MPFHSHPTEVDPKAKYDHKVRQAVIARILQNEMNLSAIQSSMQRDFLLKLSSGDASFVGLSSRSFFPHFDFGETAARFVSVCELHADFARHDLIKRDGIDGAASWWLG